MPPGFLSALSGLFNTPKLNVFHVAGDKTFVSYQPKHLKKDNCHFNKTSMAVERKVFEERALQRYEISSTALVSPVSSLSVILY